MKIFLLAAIAIAATQAAADLSSNDVFADSSNEPMLQATPASEPSTEKSSLPIAKNHARSSSPSSSSSSLSIQPIMRAIEIIEFVSKFSNSEADGTFGVNKVKSVMQPETSNDLASDSSKASSSSSSTRDDDTISALIKTNDPLTALSSLAVYGTMKLTAVALSVLMYFVAMLMPGIFGATSKNSDGNFGAANFVSSTDAYRAHLDRIDYGTIADSIRSIPIRSFAMFDIREADCQSRAMCEVGQSISGYFPASAKWIRFLAEQFNMKDLYTEAIVRGIGWTDCNTRYAQSCPRSPFKKFHQIMNTFAKFY